MLHIESVTDSCGQSLLAAYGQIDAEGVPHLRTILDARSMQTTLILDLSGVSSIDRDGSDLLQHHAAQGLILRGGSLFIRTLLRERGLQAEGG